MTCRLPHGSDWARTILAPLVAAAGYRVADSDEAEADVAILLAEDAETPAGAARALIRLRPEPEGADDDTIYRYDRDALMAALRHIRRGEAA